MDATAKPNTSAWPIAQKLLLGLALVIMSFHLFVYLVYGVELMRFPFDYDQGEGFELVDAIYISEGRLPYQDSDTYPFYSSNYPPVYRMMLAPLVWVFGVDYWYGRLVVFLSTFITAGGIAYVIARDAGRRDIAILMALGFLASNYIYHIGPLFRQHYLMVMFETLAVVLLATLFDLPSEKQRRRLMIGLGILVIAGYTKQLAAVTVVAVFLWLLLRRPLLAVVYGIGFGAVVGAIFLALNIATEGQWWNNAIAANVNQYIPSQFTGLAQQFVSLHWAVLLLAGVLVFYELYFDRLSLYAVWWVVALASTVGSGTWGAGDSYFATSLVATFMLSGIGLSRTLEGQWVLPPNYMTRPFERWTQSINRAQWRQFQQAMGTVGLAVMVIYGLTVVKIPTNGPIFGPFSEALNIQPNPGHRYPLYDAAGWTPGYATIGHLPSAEDNEAGWQIVDRIRAVDGPIFSEEAGFVLRADREVVGNPTQLQNLWDNGLLDPTELVQMIEDQAFDMVIFRARFYPEPVLAAIDNAYASREVIRMNGFDYHLWYPESTWPIRREIRNYLEAIPPPNTPLEVPLPDDVTDVEQWMLDMMARWAWLPELDLGATSDERDSDCLVRAFIRRNQITHLRVCEGTLMVDPPSPVP